MPLQFSDPVDGKYHCEAVVLSGHVLSTKELGMFCIDLPSIVYHKESVTVDYNHDQNMVLGYADNFRITDDGLVADVYLAEHIPKVQEIIELIKIKTPFEMSPSINEKEGVVEHQDGINRYKHVPMRGVAVCPFGTDRFTTLTLLKDQTMLKDKMTHLSEEKPTGESQESKVKDPDLAEFCEVYGREKGLDLWQSGADIKDIRTLKDLIEKYGVPTPPEAATTTDLNEEKPAEEKTAEGTTEEKPEAKKEVTELKAIVTALKAELTGLKAALPRGEQSPVSHNFQQEPPKKELSEKEKFIESYEKRFKK